MPFLELSLRCREDEQPRYEAALEDLGALLVTLADAAAETPEERAILEPGVGETPLWPEIALTALYPHGSDERLLLAALEAFDARLDLSTASFREVADQDWERAWMDRFASMRFGTRTWVVPWNRPLPAAARAPGTAVIRLDPGLAFGSGTHPTTALCLEWLDGLDLAGKTVLDYGCGSGILALAALALGARQAVAVDNDPQALIAARDNAARNGLADRLAAHAPGDMPDARHPVVVANILASALESLAETLARHTEAAGLIALSGLLPEQVEPVRARYLRWLDALEIAQREGWVRLSGRRREE